MSLNYPALDSLISQFEGFGLQGAPATRNNNPGNIIAGKFATNNGSIGSNNGFAVFPDPATGTQAMDSLIGHYDSMGLSVGDLIQKWSPPTAPGNSAPGTDAYTDFITKGLGVSPSTSISSAEKKTPDASSNSGISGSSISDTLKSSVLNQIPGYSVASAVTGITFARVGAFILGLILIAGGLYLFKPVQNVVNDGAKGALAA